MDDAYKTKGSENWPFQFIVPLKDLRTDNLSAVSLATVNKTEDITEATWKYLNWTLNIKIVENCYDSTDFKMYKRKIQIHRYNILQKGL